MLQGTSVVGSASLVLSSDDLHIIREKNTQLEKFFIKIVGRASELASLSSVPQASILCREIYQGLENIVTITKFAISHFEKLQNNHINQLVKIEKERTEKEGKLRECEKEIEKKKGLKASLTAEREEIKKQLDSAKKERDASQEKNRKATRELQEIAKNAFIPGHNIYSAIKSRKPQKAIPIYSQLQELKRASQLLSENLGKEVAKKEGEVRSLDEKDSTLAGQISSMEKQIKNLHQQIQRVHKERSSLDASVKSIGQQVTELSNLLKKVENLLVRYRFLQVDTKDIQDLIENGIDDPSTTKQLERDLLETRQQFAQLAI